MANIVAPRIASPSYARVRAELSQIYIQCSSRGETDKGEANDGVDPLKGSDEIPRQYSILRILFGNFGKQGEAR